MSEEEIAAEIKAARAERRRPAVPPSMPFDPPGHPRPQSRRICVDQGLRHE
jgi:hypothetical protein